MKIKSHWNGYSKWDESKKTNHFEEIDLLKKKTPVQNDQQASSGYEQSKEDAEKGQRWSQVEIKIFLKNSGIVVKIKIRQVICLENEVNERNEQVDKLGHRVNLEVVVHSVPEVETSSLGEDYEVDWVGYEAEQTYERHQIAPYVFFQVKNGDDHD